MDVEERLKRNNLHKLLILAIKYTPLVIALCYILNTILAWMGVYFDPLSNIAGMSLITWLFTYIATIVFKFCAYHRMFLWYILADDMLNIIDYYFELPITSNQIIMLHNSIIGLLLFALLVIYVKSNKGEASSDNK
jgi:hypothetical protein